MTQINRLSTTTVSASDLIPVFSTPNADARKISISALAEYINGLLAPAGFITQYSSPAATGFSVQIVNPGENTFLLLTPLAGYAAGTIVLPDPTANVDGQEFLLTTTQAVTTLTVSGGAVNPATVNGAPTTLAANAFFRLRYDAVNASWYRVG